MKIDFNIKHNSRGYIVIRESFPYEFHAHIKDLSTCNTLLKLIENNKMPKSEYLRGSCKRLLTEEEFGLLKPFKQRYYNVNKGVKSR